MDLPAAGRETGITLCRVLLFADSETVTRALAVLDEEERARASAFQREDVRRRFILRRAARRLILAAETAAEPADLRFGQNPAGKPHLLGPNGPAGLEFNCSDSDDIAVVAVGRAGRLGVDIEMCRPLIPDLWAIREWFAPDECAQLEALPPGQRTDAFHQCWTRKEAVLKALGTGLQVPLNSFSVPQGVLAPEGTHVDGPDPQQGRFFLYPLPTGVDTQACLAAEFGGATLRWHALDWGRLAVVPFDPIATLYTFENPESPDE